MINFRPPTAYAKSLNYLENDADDIKPDPLTTTNICADANLTTDTRLRSLKHMSILLLIA